MKNKFLFFVLALRKIIVETIPITDCIPTKKSLKQQSSNMTKKIIIAVLCLCVQMVLLAQQTTISGQIFDAENGQTLSDVSVYYLLGDQTVYSNKKGQFVLENVKTSPVELIFFKENFQSITQYYSLDTLANQMVSIYMKPFNFELDAVQVTAEQKDEYGVRQLRNVEGVAIYAAKKSEVIELDNLVANLATNNARQVFKGIAGLNIWETDGAGLQLSIGARGLNPNRTSNFNTRQNGYDISADALGYPESYYTPPTQALRKIEIVRGAASLQYGSQFGGVLNFAFKKGHEKKPLEFFTENTIGSFGLFSSFTSLGGTINGYNYYTFYQRKQGDGWRPNGVFDQNTAFVNVSKTFKDKLTIGVEYTYMDYLAQQAGGLQDYEFAQNPRQSKRSRNWFGVNWNLGAVTIDYQITEKTKINTRTFGLYAQRQALGELGPINRPDPLRERDLIRGKYQNWGNETRLITRYNIGQQMATFLVGMRYYQGYSTSEQGDGTNGSDANFTFLNPNDLEKAAYSFPSRNLAFFAENLFYLHDKWTVTPGIRWEYIRTASDGYYKERVFSGGQVIFEQKYEDQRSKERNFVLLGLGVGHKPNEQTEMYANFSQNYRSINFSDLAVVNPNLEVDSLLQDERGFNADIGFRGKTKNNILRFDASLFYLQYQNRIGVGEIVVPDPVVIEKAVAYRTNIGDARIIGAELYMEADIFNAMQLAKKDSKLSVFANVSALHGKYTSGQSAFVGNDVELIPPISIKTGVGYQYKNFKSSYQFTYVAQQFSDATNAELVVDATRGIIPSYSVHDLSLSYQWRKWKLQTGVNNMTDAAYFTRRAVAYPGPGIIPADGRSFYLTVAIKL